MDKSGSNVSIQDRLEQLAEAERLVCGVLQLTVDTCEELEKLPFSDQDRLMELSSSVVSNLKSVRKNVADNIIAIDPAGDNQATMAQHESTVRQLQAIVDKFEPL
jgi:hypothetical protein